MCEGEQGVLPVVERSFDVRHRHLPVVKRRLKVANLPATISPHSFHSCTATDLLLDGMPLEDVQYLLGHADAAQRAPTTGGRSR